MFQKLQGKGMRVSGESFYVVAATVIPVFFLALTFQGTLFNAMDEYLASLLNSNEDFYDHWVKRIQKNERIQLTAADSKKVLFQGVRLIVVRIVTLVVTLMLFLSAIGEYVALQALYNQSATKGEHQTVLLAVQVLTIGTAAFLLIRLYVRIYTAKYRVFRLFVEQLYQYLRTVRAQENAASVTPTQSSAGSLTNDQPTKGRN